MYASITILNLFMARSGAGRRRHAQCSIFQEEILHFVYLLRLFDAFPYNVQPSFI